MSVRLNDKSWLTPGEVAKRVGISRWMVIRTIQKRLRAKTKNASTKEARVIRDTVTGRIYIAEDALAMFTDRFEVIKIQI